MPQPYTVNGFFLTQRLSGIQRYATEILAALDPMLAPGELEIAVPQGTKAPHYQNIRVVPVAGARAWEQCAYPRYLAQNNRRWLCLCNVIPLTAARRTDGIAVWHDVCYRARPDFYTDPRGRVSAAWHCAQYRAMAARAQKIITVSQFSKSEIVKYYNVDPAKLTVIYNAWQQIERVTPEEGVFAAHPELQKGQYYFAMANLLKNKNFPWVLRAAKAKPDAVFAVAGGGSLSAEARRLGLEGLPNVIYLGYVSDGEAKALMQNCRAFLFPTLYEGFGIPPLEAIACGAPLVLVSDTPCMREIYGNCAGYIDLQTNVGNVDAVTKPKAEPAALLQKYSWQQSARALLALLQEK